MNLEKKVLTAFLRSWLKKKFDELGREVGSALEGTEVKVRHAKPLLLECLEEAFRQQAEEYRAKWAKDAD